jgi:hypothetical protein
MERFARVVQELSGNSCEGLSIKECSDRAMMCPEFYENPRKFFIAMADALPNSQKAWLNIFMTTFIFADFVSAQEPHSVCASRRSAQDFPVYPEVPSCESILLEENQG